MSHWYQRWKTSTPTDPKGPRVMNPSEEIANLRKEATRRLTELHHELYGDSVEEDNAQ
jgi:hypothetical protein